MRSPDFMMNKGADQHVRPRRLISTDVVRCLDGIKPLVYTFRPAVS